MPKHATEVKWVFWALLSWVALAVGLIWCLIHIYSNSQYIAVGKSIDCDGRPSFEYFRYCNAIADGVACMHENRTRMMAFYESIDSACSQFDEQRPFVFPAYYEPEAIEVASTE